MGYGSVLREHESDRVDEVLNNHWDKRERLWLEKIKDTVFTRCLFILGHKHLHRFVQLLKTQGIENKILIEDFGNGAQDNNFK